jgi:biotin carboxylase
MTDEPTICVIGTDDFTFRMVQELAAARDWRVHPVMSALDVLPRADGIDFDAALDRARRSIDDLDTPPDALIGHLDFPVTAMVALLNRERGLRGATPKAVARLENKYWLRQTQAEVFPDRTPACVPLNPFDPEAARRDAPPYPFWLKPVKAHSSVLGMRVCDEGDLEAGLHACRLSIHRHGEAFNAFLRHVEDPGDVDEAVDGNFAVAEELIAAPRLFTIEGYVRDGETVAHGVIDSIRGGASGTSLVCYRYPGEVPDATVETAREIAAGMLEAVGFDDGPFNVEFFHDPETGALHLLEINPRISKSHSPLMKMVDGASHHLQAIQIALGEAPDPPARAGPQPMAAKFMLRSGEADGIVRRVPGEAEIRELQRLLPALETQILVEPGQRLSDLPDQDSYSYELADLFIGGSDREVIEDAYARCLDSLEFAIKPLPERHG